MARETDVVVNRGHEIVRIVKSLVKVDFDIADHGVGCLSGEIVTFDEAVPEILYLAVAIEQFGWDSTKCLAAMECAFKCYYLRAISEQSFGNIFQGVAAVKDRLEAPYFEAVAKQVCWNTLQTSAVLENASEIFCFRAV